MAALRRRQTGLSRAACFAAALSLSIVGAKSAAGSCLELTDLSIPDTVVTLAQINGGTFVAPDGSVFNNLPTFCRVAATLTPTMDSNIRIEVWMPFDHWNGRYLGVGNQGIGGSIFYPGLAGTVQLGYASANTDLGTSPSATDPLGGRILTGHPEKQIDLGTRSTHLMTVRAKQIIEAFYGQPPQFSYFNGCSAGGGQGIHEALQFPADYDGIVAGAPFINRTGNAAGFTWNYAAFNRNPVNLSAAQAAAITSAVIKRCAGRDGGLSSDNFLTDPRACRWDPSVLQCTGGPGDASTCLTTAQVVAMRLYYQGPTNPRTGERILAGLLPGSESNGTGGPVDTETRKRPNSSVPYWVFGNSWDWRSFDFDHDMDTIDTALAATLNANTAKLDEFKLHGGKLIIFHGVADPLLPTLHTVDYYERLIGSQTPGNGRGKGEREVGLRRTQDFARLFLGPGMGHCIGGAGPDNFFNGMQPDIENWVEHGIAPDQLIASKMAGGATLFTRPLCPYPALPRYGTGDPTKASSFVCVADTQGNDNQPPASKYIDDGQNYPIVPIQDQHRQSGDAGR